MVQHSGSGRIEADDPQTVASARALNPGLAQSAIGSEPAYEPPVERRREENRRKSVLRAFFYGNFRPRRRGNRRATDEHLFLVDWHEPRILYLSLCILLLSCTDALFTLNLLNAGASEANAVMASMLEQGIDVFLASKIGITSFSLVILVVAARRKFIGSFSVEHLLQVFCLGYIMVIYYEIYLFRFVFKLDIF